MAAPLTAERLRELLDYDPETGGFTWRTSRNGRVLSGSVAGSPAHSGHIRISIDKRLHMAHRLAWLYVHGTWPKDQIDHINGVPSDNRILNLREATPAQNMENQNRAHANNKTGFLGVSEKDGQFLAHIYQNKRQIYLGAYDTPEEAHAAYVAAKNDLHEFGQIKKPEGASWHDRSLAKGSYRAAKKGSSSGILGVSSAGKKWRATATINKRTVNIGTYSTKEEAAAARAKFLESIQNQ